MRPAEFAAAFVAVLAGTAILAVAAPDPTGAATEVPPKDPPAVEAPARPVPALPEPETATLSMRMGVKRLIYLYPPTVPANPNARAILYLSGDWGWRPLQRETAAHLAGKGRYIVGIDSVEYFDRRLEPSDWLADLTTLKTFVNEKAGKPPESPVTLIGFTFGGELIPYMLNRGGTKGFGGALLISLDWEGSAIYHTAIQLKLPVPSEDAFSVAEEIHQLPRKFPIFFLDGALDTQSALRPLMEVARGPRRSATIDGADRQFRLVREAYLAQVVQALTWLEGPHAELVPGSPATTPPGGR